MGCSNMPDPVWRVGIGQNPSSMVQGFAKIVAPEM
jgi:hypothetical protein